MATLLFFNVFFGFFLCYNTSQKAELNRDFMLVKIGQGLPRTNKIIGTLLMLVALIGSILYYGTGAGIFAFLILLMTAGSMIVLIAPLRFVGYKAVSALFLISLILELIF